MIDVWWKENVSTTNNTAACHWTSTVMKNYWKNKGLHEFLSPQWKAKNKPITDVPPMFLPQSDFVRQRRLCMDDWCSSFKSICCWYFFCDWCCCSSFNCCRHFCFNDCCCCFWKLLLLHLFSWWTLVLMWSVLLTLQMQHLSVLIAAIVTTTTHAQMSIAVAVFFCVAI